MTPEVVEQSVAMAEREAWKKALCGEGVTKAGVEVLGPRDASEVKEWLAGRDQALAEVVEHKWKTRCHAQRRELRRLNQKLISMRAVLHGPWCNDASKLKQQLVLRENDWRKERARRVELEAEVAKLKASRAKEEG
jgi:hypothetical protein